MVFDADLYDVKYDGLYHMDERRSTRTSPHCAASSTCIAPSRVAYILRMSVDQPERVLVVRCHSKLSRIGLCCSVLACTASNNLEVVVDSFRSKVSRCVNLEVPYWSYSGSCLLSHGWC